MKEDIPSYIYIYSTVIYIYSAMIAQVKKTTEVQNNPNKIFQKTIFRTPRQFRRREILWSWTQDIYYTKSAVKTQKLGPLITF